MGRAYTHTIARGGQEPHARHNTGITPTFCNRCELSLTAPGIFAANHILEVGLETPFVLFLLVKILWEILVARTRKELREEILALSHMLYDLLTDCHVHLFVVVDKKSDRVEHAVPWC